LCLKLLVQSVEQCHKFTPLAQHQIAEIGQELLVGSQEAVKNGNRSRLMHGVTMVTKKVTPLTTVTPCVLNLVVKKDSRGFGPTREVFCLGKKRMTLQPILAREVSMAKELLGRMCHQRILTPGRDLRLHKRPRLLNAHYVGST